MASGKKNYFRHSFFAHNDEFICDMVDKYGLQSYYYWFVLLELCGAQSAQELQKSYKFHKRTLCHSLRINTRKLNIYLGYLQDMCKISYTITENTYEIIVPNLPKYLGKYTTKNEPKSTKKRKVNKSKVKEIKIIKKACDFDIEKIYNAYPKKAGKKNGMEKLKKIVTTQQIFDEILQGAEKYAKYCEQNKTEKQFIKQFSSWVNQECWQDDYEIKNNYPEFGTTLSEDEIW